MGERDLGHPQIFISAGDVSGDLHGGNLVQAMRALAPEAEIVGLGGPRMRDAGMRLLADTVEFGIIRADPRECVNLAFDAGHRARCAEFKARLMEWHALTEDPLDQMWRKRHAAKYGSWK